MDIFLQFWGGIYFLLNKIFFWRAERSQGELARKWEIWAWIVYLIGLPAVVAMFAREHNWIFAALEAGGTPLLVLGLVNAVKGKKEEKEESKWPMRFIKIAILMGFGYSLYEFGGIRLLTQWVEAGAAVTFLVGSHRRAKKHPDGYLWYVPMHVLTTWLMWTEHRPWFALQQVASLVFVVDAYYARKHKQSTSQERNER